MSSALRMTEEQLAERSARLSASQQQRLAFTGRERKDTLTVAELKALRPERDLRAEILAACLAYPRVAWLTRCETYRGYVLPVGMLRAFERTLYAHESWSAKAVLRELHKALAWREFAAAGMADLIGQLQPCGPGTVGAPVALEVKRPGEKAKEHQEAFLDLVARAGGCAGVVHDAREAIGRIDAFCATQGGCR